MVHSNSLIPKILMATILAACVITCAPLFAEENFEPTFLPELYVPRLNSSIEIDGDLNDTGWKGAARVSKFHEHFPGDQTKPPVETEAMITYDNKHIYVAFVCYDDPHSIRATLCQRDQAHQDDLVFFLLDTYGDGSWAYEIYSNPYGVQGDFLFSTYGGEDDSYDLIYETAAEITDSGYQVEMAIPFSSLRFPDREEQNWRADFWRNHPRDIRRQYSWSAIDRDQSCWPCQWGILKGIESVHPGHGLEILPSFIGYRNGFLEDDGDPNSVFKNKDPDGEASIGVKYSISSGITAEASFNPDYSQVESDAIQIDVNSTFALWYSEKRPFFQEGSDLFKTWFNVVYTRSINDPLLAGKLIGRMNKTNLAYLVAYDENSPVIIPYEEGSSNPLLLGKSYSNIFRASQILGEESHIGVMLTDRRYDIGGSGTVIGLDGAMRFLKFFRFECQFLSTHTSEPDDTSITTDDNGLLFDNNRHTADFDGESFWGHGIYASLERSSRNWWFDLDYYERSPRFRLDNGYETGNNSRQIDLETGAEIYINSKILATIHPYLMVAREWNFANERKDEWIAGQLGFQLLGQTYAEIGHMESREKFRGIIFSNINNNSFTIDSRFSKPLWLGIYYSRGHRIARNVDPDPIMGKEQNFSVWATIKPFDRLVIRPSYDYAKSDSLATGGKIFEGYTFRNRLNLQITRGLSFRFITQYSDFSKIWEFDPLITYQLNPFTLCYFGSTHDFNKFDDYPGVGMTEVSRQLFFKLQYLFQT
jgi:hypothetical protein